MENYIAILLLVIPGFLSRKVYKQTHNVDENLNQFEEMLYCLFNSTIITLIMFIGMMIFSYISIDFSISSITQLFDRMSFVIGYAVLILILSGIYGLCILPLLKAYNWLVNKFRNRKDGEIGISHTIFDDYFNDGNYHFVEVYKDGKLIGRGGIKISVEKYKEIYLENAEEGYDELLTAYNVNELPYKGIYIDGKTGLVIKEITIP